MKIVNVKYYYYLLCKKRLSCKDGFTLIELLVVVIIIGILAAVALPNFLGQVGKAREAEVKSNLGAISRSQQIYHYEKKVFADTMIKLAANGSFTGEYYNYRDPDIANNSLVRQKATSVDPVNNLTKDYAIGLYYNAGAYESILCQAAKVGDLVEAPNSVADPCTNGGLKVR